MFLGLCTQLGFSQTYQFKTVNYSVSQKNAKGEWSKWSKTLPTELLINLDRDKHRFVVYSEIIQLYSILKYEDKVENIPLIIKKKKKTKNENSLFIVLSKIDTIEKYYSTYFKDLIKKYS